MTKRLQLLGLALLSSACSIFAQNDPSDFNILNRTCGTPPPSQEWNDWFNKEVEKFKENLKTGRARMANYTIPVVVHILHTGQAVGTYPNIDSNRVKAQIRVLNEDFGGIGYNPLSITQYSALIANTGVQFCLATKNPTGGVMPERGIDRINSQTQFSVNPTTLNSSSALQNFINNTVKPATIWDPTRYFNVWISEQGSGSGLLGYATFPAGTSLPGIAGGGGATSDGVWCVTNSFGSNAPGYNGGTTNYATNYDKGRTLSHEAGHWVGLRHVWGDGNCLTDFCNDTPPAAAANFGCPSSYPFHVNSCGAGLSPQGEMTMNIMDYSDDRCMFMFTPDQTTRIQTAMSQGTFRNLLGTHGLCASAAPPAPGPAVASFTFGTQSPCFGYPFTPINNSTGGPTPTFAWSISPPTATFAPNANVAAPSINLASTGNYTLTLVATNSVATSTYSYAFNATVCPKPPVCIDTLSMIKTTDTMKVYSVNPSTLVIGCNNSNPGFLTGTNCYKDKEFAQYFPSSTYSDTPIPQLNGVIVLFYKTGTKANNPATQIYCNLWGGNLAGGPTTLLQQKGDSIAKITMTVAGTSSTIASPTNVIQFCGTPTYTFSSKVVIPYTFKFSPPALLPTNGFFVGVEAPWGSLVDSMQILSNTLANALPGDTSAFVRTSTNNWFNLKSQRSKNVQLAILPIISCRAQVGLQEYKNDFAESVMIVPNPNNGVFNIVTSFNKENNLTIRTYNYLGQLIGENKENNVSNHLFEIDLSERGSGVYFIEVNNGMQKTVKKVIVNK